MKRCLCYARIRTMLKRPLLETNPYLRDPAKRHEMFCMTVCTSTGIEGVRLPQTELEKGFARSPQFTAVHESVTSSGSRH